jgi:ABC-2 type transport system ATP-binding protein
MNHSLVIEGLTKKIGDFTLQNISFELPKGYILGYVGQNGAGKTTTIKLIMSMLKQDMGMITVNGKKVKDNEVEYKNSIGYISEKCYFPEEFTLKDIEDTLVSFYPSFNQSKFKKLTEQWELPYKKKIKDYSRGMQVRTMFAAVLARDTKLLLLDEATSGLDPVVRSEILELIQDYIADGERSVLFSTHIMSDLEQVADYIYFLDKGKMVIKATKDELMEQYVMVKGGMEDLHKVLEEKLIGIKKSKVGFEGLLSTEYMDYTGRHHVVERPTIEQIIVLHIKDIRRSQEWKH